MRIIEVGASRSGMKLCMDEIFKTYADEVALLSVPHADLQPDYWGGTRRLDRAGKRLLGEWPGTGRERKFSAARRGLAATATRAVGRGGAEPALPVNRAIALGE